MRGEQNLRLYRAYLLLFRAYFWAPVFFLYFLSRFPLEEVLWLEAIYYFAVVAFEVPSGYLSDRIGRVPTLRISAFASALGYGLFVAGGESYLVFVAAQVSIAISFSFASGTDTAFHYDTLVGLGRGDEYGRREAALQRDSLLARSASALVGGAVAVVGLGLAYALSMVAAALAFGLTLRFSEPPRDPDEDGAPRPWAQLRRCVAAARSPVLLWLFAYVVFETTLEHLPYEFAQPYVAAALGESIGSVQRTPLVTGAVAAVIAAVGALAAAWSLGLRARLGTAGALLAVTALQTLTVVSMAVWVHPWVIALIALRSVHPAVSQVLTRAEVTPRLPQSLRATYLSLQSLVGRLGFSGLLFGLGVLVGERGASDPEMLSRLLRACAVIAVLGTLALFATRRAARADGAR